MSAPKSSTRQRERRKLATMPNGRPRRVAGSTRLRRPEPDSREPPKGKIWRFGGALKRGSVRFWQQMVSNPAAAVALLAVIVTAATFIVTSKQTNEGQVTDRYIRAVAQLGDPALDVRLGGIYALERLARDSPEDQPTVVEVLSAYVRDHLAFADLSCIKVDEGVQRSRDLIPTPSDIRAAIVVLARRDRDNDDGTTADLFGVCLPGSYVFRGLDLRGFSLAFANLDDSLLIDTKLGGAIMSGADLLRVDFTGAELSNATITGAYLTKAKNANLEGALGVPRTLP